MASELRPCPRCLATGEILYHHGDRWLPQCPACGLSGPTYFVRDEAVAWWNTRVPDPLLAEMATAIEKTLRDYEFTLGSSGGDKLRTVLARYRVAYPETQEKNNGEA